MKFILEQWQAGVEILILWVGVYFIYRALKNTRGARILLGLLLLIVVLFLVSHVLKLQIIGWLLYKALALLAIALLIIFQPELRDALARLGSTKLFFFTQTQRHEFLETFVEATQQLSKKRYGALFAIERNISLKEHLSTGVELDALFSKEFSLTVFHPKSALHDGGMIISNNRVAGAGCVFPVSSREISDRSIGLRHRAGIGITENSDCICVIVSEESGRISVSENGKLKTNLNEKELHKEMEDLLLPKEKTDENEPDEELARENSNSDSGNRDMVSD